MNTKAPKSFDQLWRKSGKLYLNLGWRAERMGHHLKEFLCMAYEYAEVVLDMQKNHHNRLVDMIASEGTTVSAWMDEHFELIEELNRPRTQIFEAIEAGVTKRQYVRDNTVRIGQKRLKAAKLVAKDDGVILRPSGEPKTLEEQVRKLQDVYESMVSKYQGVRHELKVTRRVLGEITVRNTKLEGTITRLKKDIVKLDEAKAATA